MFRKAKKILAISLAAALLSAQAAYADTVITAPQPELTEAAGNHMSSTGPSGQKEVGADGYVVVGSDGRNSNEYVNAGPGAGGIPGTGTGNQSGSGNIIISGGTQSGTQQSGGTVQGPAGQQTGGTAAQSGNATGQITLSDSIAKPSIYSEAAILYDATTGQVLYEKNSQKAMYPASTTKLMTALLAAERLNLDDTVTYSQTATH